MPKGYVTVIIQYPEKRNKNLRLGNILEDLTTC